MYIARNLKTEIMKLISMTDFVLEILMNGSESDFINNCINYANFLKQPLKLEMFVPCDDSEQAKEKVLFEYKPQFKLWDNTDLKNQNIEDLLTDDIEYFLTENTTKQFL